jgi:hypothetical protein
MGARPGLANLRPVRPGESSPALKHGGRSEIQIGRGAAAAKRRLLRQIGLRQADLDGIGQALLLNWSRAAAALTLMDAYAGEHGWLDPAGAPRPFTTIYLAVLNTEQRCLSRLDGHLRERNRDRGRALRDYVESEYAEAD